MRLNDVDAEAIHLIENDPKMINELRKWKKEEFNPLLPKAKEENKIREKVINYYKKMKKIDETCEKAKFAKPQVQLRVLNSFLISINKAIGKSFKTKRYFEY